MGTASSPGDRAPAPGVEYRAANVLRLAAVVYTAFVVYGSLLPFDFRAGELAEPLKALALSGSLGHSRTDWATNIALFVPLALLWTSATPADTAGRAWQRAALVLCGCALLSASIEFAQVWLPTRSSSVGDLTRNVLGAVLGILLGPVVGAPLRRVTGTLLALHAGGTRPLRTRAAVALPLLVGYGMALATLAGWFTRPWVGWGAGLARLPSFDLLPLSYHQQASILVAAPSTIVASCAYLPVGVLRWMVGDGGRGAPLATAALRAALWGGATAACFEASKVFLDGKRPDTGNIAIAMLAAATGFFLAPLLLRRAEPPARTTDAAPWAVALWRPGPWGGAWRNWVPLVVPLAGGVAFTSAMVFIVTRAPFMPYRVRELPNPFHPVLALLILASYLYWTFAGPAVIAGWLVQARRWGWAYPLVVVLHALLAWAQLYYGVLPESIHVLVGTPVLSWPWRWEMIARFVTLYSVLSVALTGAALVVLGLKRERVGGAFLRWGVWAAVLFPFQYSMIVIRGGTDNLTELMARGASVDALLMLASYLMVIGLAGSFVASLGLAGGPRRLSLAFAIAAASLPVGYLLLALGTEGAMDKYGTTISALQSLLSMDRKHYATGAELWLRVFGLHTAAVAGIAFAQYPLWKRGPALVAS